MQSTQSLYLLRESVKNLWYARHHYSLYHSSFLALFDAYLTLDTIGFQFMPISIQLRTFVDFLFILAQPAWDRHIL